MVKGRNAYKLAKKLKDTNNTLICKLGIIQTLPLLKFRWKRLSAFFLQQFNIDRTFYPKLCNCTPKAKYFATTLFHWMAGSSNQQMAILVLQCVFVVELFCRFVTVLFNCRSFQCRSSRIGSSQIIFLLLFLIN